MILLTKQAPAGVPVAHGESRSRTSHFRGREGTLAATRGLWYVLIHHSMTRRFAQAILAGIRRNKIPVRAMRVRSSRLNDGADAAYASKIHDESEREICRGSKAPKAQGDHLGAGAWGVISRPRTLQQNPRFSFSW